MVERTRKRRSDPTLPRIHRATGRERAQRRLERTTVLVVEDHRETREMYAELFGAHGATAIEAASVPDAMRVLESLSPDVVVVDVGLEGVDGLTLVRRMAAHPAWSGIRRVVASGRSSAEEVHAHDPRAVYFEKPVDLVALVEAARPRS